MPQFDVHSYSVVRIKVTGIEAENHKAAIAALEADSQVHADVARMVSYDKPGEKIETIEMDEGAMATGYLVDRVGDEDYSNSISYDVDRDGNPVAVGCRPGERVPLNDYQRVVLESYADGDLRPMIEEAPDQFTVANRLEREFDDLLPIFILKELASVLNRREALQRMDQAIEDLKVARGRIEELGA